VFTLHDHIQENNVLSIHVLLTDRPNSQSSDGETTQYIYSAGEMKPTLLLRNAVETERKPATCERPMSFSCGLDAKVCAQFDNILAWSRMVVERETLLQCSNAALKQ
jgi:hypothetical protein